MKTFQQLELRFVTGSQDLYGEATLRRVDEHAREIVASLDSSQRIPVRVVQRPVVKAPTRSGASSSRRTPAQSSLDGGTSASVVARTPRRVSIFAVHRRFIGNAGLAAALSSDLASGDAERERLACRIRPDRGALC